MSRAPVQKPGRSKQTYQTPDVFLWAVKRRLGVPFFALDVAADADNTVARRFYSIDDNGLRQSWVADGWTWCNPPFAHIEPWVQRAFEQSRVGARIALLLPAGVGANWWRDWVHGKACALLLNGRLTFVGETAPYPKDCVLLLYGPGVAPGYDVWTWMESQP